MSDKQPLNRPVVLEKKHDRKLFDCGSIELNDFLKKYARQNQQKGLARTYVATRGNVIIAYYSLAFGSVSPEESPPRITKGLGRYSVPIILLARLAVDKSEQGSGLGKAMLKDALLRTLQAADIAGLRAMLVHAKDDSAKSFYQKYGFEPSPTNEFHLFLSISDIKKNCQV